MQSSDNVNMLLNSLLVILQDEDSFLYTIVDMICQMLIGIFIVFPICYLLYKGLKYAYYYFLGLVVESVEALKKWRKDSSRESKEDKLLALWTVLWVGLILAGAFAVNDTLSFLGIGVLVVGGIVIMLR